jgi:predicted HTH domain antitoxin
VLTNLFNNTIIAVVAKEDPMKVTIDIPDSYALYFGLSGIERQLKLFTALMLVKQGKISVSRAAELAEITIYDFLKQCKENDIPVVDYSKEELKEEFENIKREPL